MLEGTTGLHTPRPEVCRRSSLRNKRSLRRVDFLLCFHLSAVLYLNDNFEGGDLFFTSQDAKKVTVSHFINL